MGSCAAAKSEEEILYTGHPDDFYANQIGNKSLKGIWFRNRQYTTRKLVRKYYQGGLILDIGCGNCLWQYEGPRVVGVDINHSMLRKNRTRFPGAFFPMESDVTAGLPFKAGSMEIVVITELMEHFDTCDWLVAEIYRVLKPGGIIICSVPYSRLPGIWNILFAPMCALKGFLLDSDFYRKRCGHKVHFGKKEIGALCGRFTPLECFDLYKLTIFYCGRKTDA